MGGLVLACGNAAGACLGPLPSEETVGVRTSDDTWTKPLVCHSLVLDLFNAPCWPTLHLQGQGDVL